MKKIIIPAVLLASSLILSACVKTPTSTVNGTSPIPSVKTQSKTSSFSGSIKDLATLGKSQKCTWEIPDQGQGIVYVSDKKTFSEINLKETDKNSARQMFSITNDGWVYTWDTSTKKGSKIKLNNTGLHNDSPTETTTNRTEVSENNQPDQTAIQNYNFKCESWIPDNNKFTPPADINFTNMNTILEKTRNQVQDLKQACDILSGKAKEDCLKNFAK